MILPRKAIIACPTEKDADELFAFLGELNYTYGGIKMTMAHNAWDVYRQETCYSLHREQVVCRTNREAYESYCRQYDDDVVSGYDYMRNREFIPDELELRFIHARDFIALFGDNPTQKIESETLLSLL